MPLFEQLGDFCSHGGSVPAGLRFVFLRVDYEAELARLADIPTQRWTWRDA